MIRGICILIILPIGCTRTTPAPPAAQPIAATPRSVAESQLKSLSRNSQWKMLGVLSAQEASSATLGSPLSVYVSRADEISNYGGGDLKQVLHSTENIVFPVLLNGGGRMLIEVGNRDGKWVPLRDGYQDSAADLVEVTKTNPQDAVGFVKIGSLDESNYLVEGKAEAASGNGPGGGSELIKRVDMTSSPLLIPLNGSAKALAVRTEIPRSEVMAEATKESQVLGNTGLVGLNSIPGLSEIAPRTPFPKSEGPGAPAEAKPESADKFFKKIAPVARQASVGTDGPG